MIGEIIFLAFLILLSGFFSGSETALFSLSDIKIHSLVETDVRGAKNVQKIKSNPHKLLTVLLIANNLVNISASALATVIAIDIFGSRIGPGIATGVMTLLILTFGEITPKSFAIVHNVRFSLFAARPLHILSILLFPFVYVFEKLSRLVTSEKTDEPTVSEEELKTMITLGAKEGTIGHEEKRMIHGVLKLEDKQVYNIMTPRSSVFILDQNKRVKEVIKKIMKKGYSRVPVYDKRLLNVTGVVYAKDILRVLYKNKNPYLKDIMRKPFIVPERKKIDDLLEEFKAKRNHLAFVVNEHGDFSGIVTIEDLLEEIVGEIYDETDKEEITLKRLNRKTYIVSGKAEVAAVTKTAKISMDADESGEYETINGLIQHKTGKIPQQGEKISFKRFNVEILESTPRMVIKAKIIKKD